MSYRKTYHNRKDTITMEQYNRRKDDKDKIMREQIAYALIIAGKNLITVAMSIRNGTPMEEVQPLIEQVNNTLKLTNGDNNNVII